MSKMTEETIKEIIKSIAYDYTPEDISNIYGISIDECNEIIKTNKSEIEAEKEYLKNIGN